MIIEFDTALSPALARRSLFIGRNGSSAESLTGISMPLQDWLARTCSLGTGVVSKRDDLVAAIVPAEKPEPIAGAIQEEVPGRPVYLLSRASAHHAGLERWAAAGLAVRVAGEKSWSIYRFDPSR